MAGPKVLIVDIETAPLEVYCWGLFDQNIALNQIKEDWSILCWSAKWLDGKKVFYQGVGKQKNKRDDSTILKKIWKLMDTADIIIGQNSSRFDVKKLNARFILNGMKPPSSYRQLDTMKIAKKYFSFTSNKLEYTSGKLCTKYSKLKHNEFAGFDLWKECLAGNRKAWASMERYNRHDVLVTEEYYKKISGWDNSINFDVYRSDEQNICACGHPKFLRWGFRFTNAGKFQRFKCGNCGREHVGKENLLTKMKRKTLRK
jgi:hypothetical protein